MDDVAAFARLIEALAPWLGHLVIVGGWAHRLHRFHPLACPPAYPPLRTRDADIAFSLRAPLDGNIRVALDNAGFTQHSSGEHTPPITDYRLGDEDAGFSAEFLTSLQGSGLKRSGEPDVTISKAGITAQKLRHLDLLLTVPSTVRLGPEVGVPVEGRVDLMVANPVSFMVQKMLIHKHRNPGKKAQDVLYIHDTLELFGASLDDLRTLWLDQVRAAMPAKTAKTAVTTARDLFREVTDTIRNAVRIPQDRRLMPDRVRAACEYGLEEILGDVG